jgi:hypothetical protein
MEKSASKRALRRHHARRLKCYYQQAHDWANANEKRDPVAAGKHFQTPHPCSCFMCGHRRRWYGVSLAERKNLLGFAEQMVDIG